MNTFVLQQLLTSLLAMVIFAVGTAYGIAWMFNKQSRVTRWLKKQTKCIWNKHWKFFVGFGLGIFIGVALQQPAYQQ